MGKRIVIGLENITSRYADLEKGLKQHGHTVTTVSLQRTPNRSGRKADVILAPRLPGWMVSLMGIKLCKKFNELLKLVFHRFHGQTDRFIRDNDVFIFLWWTFDPKFRDLQKIHEAGKTIITLFVGDDIRWYPAMRQDFLKHGLTPVEYPNTWYFKSIRGLKIRMARLRNAERYADFIFSRREQSQLQLRPFYHLGTTNVNMDLFDTASTQRDEPVIVHAPSNESIKGTKYVLNAIETLEREGLKFSFRFITNMTHAEALHEIKEADIIIDQLFLPGGGRLSSEGLAFGNVVVSRMALETYKQGAYQDGCPIVDADPESILPVLRSIILDRPKREQLAKAGRVYAEKQLDVSVLTDKIARLIQGEHIEPEFKPTFFRDEFIPESDEAITIYNHWTAQLKDCKWYANTILEGTRNKLEF